MSTSKYKKDDLGNRMKNYYENIPKTKLMRRTPVAIRLDGKAFHTFTKGFNKPFDEVMYMTMRSVTRGLCENIQGCVFGYTQSDEITLILIDYQNLNTDAWFDYEVQKICSVSASMATLLFNKAFAHFTMSLKNTGNVGVYAKALNNGAMFDSRCFNIPREEVVNLIYWRQMDAMRNSVQALGQANFPHRELQGLSSADIKQKLKVEKDIDWDNLHNDFKYGIWNRKTEKGWEENTHKVLLVGEDRKLLEDLIIF